VNVKATTQFTRINLAQVNRNEAIALVVAHHSSRRSIGISTNPRLHPLPQHHLQAQQQPAVLRQRTQQDLQLLCLPRLIARLHPTDHFYPQHPSHNPLTPQLHYPNLTQLLLSRKHILQLHCPSHIQLLLWPNHTRQPQSHSRTHYHRHSRLQDHRRCPVITQQMRRRILFMPCRAPGIYQLCQDP
jgi:hypothetical protein